MPFLVDSVTAELNRRGHTVHLVIHPIVPVSRAAGRLVSIGGDGASLESMMHFEMDEVTDPAALDGIRSALERVLADVRAAVEDWRPTRDRLQATIAELGEGAPTVPSEEAAEAAEFLRWLDDNHFTFLGSRAYVFEGGGPELRAVAVTESSLGLLARKGVVEGKRVCVRVDCGGCRTIKKK